MKSELLRQGTWLANDDMRQIPLLRGLVYFGGWAKAGGGAEVMEVGAALWLELEKEDLLRPFSSGRLSDFVWFV